MPGTFKQLLLKRDIKSLFNFERDKKPANTCSCYFDAYIVASETLLEETKASKKFTVYKISVTNGPIHWFVLKRYSEFHKLHSELQALFPHVRLPSLPPKRLIGNNTSPSFVQGRKQRLGQYLREISEDPILCSSEPILEFFQDITIAQENLYGTSTNDTSSQSELSSCRNGGTKRRTFSFQVVRQKLKFKNKKFSMKRRKLTNKTATKTTDLFSSSTIHEKTPMGLEDFFLIKVIGKGSYGKVILARHKDSGRLLAIKSILKKQIHQKPIDVGRIMAERNVLKQNASHPFLVGLHYAFQTPDRLCFCIDYINGGELFYHLQHMPRFEEDRARFYVAEITSALEYLHSMSIVYRDLKPENCLLDGQGHIRLVDFGLAKQILGGDGTTSTFCGTPEYLAPEVLQHRSYDKTVDWYCLGAVLYEMLSGMPPFYSSHSADMYERILNEKLRFPANIGATARSLISKLMDRNPSTRLGSGPSGSNDVKLHRYFKGIDWDCLVRKSYEPPWKPNVGGLLDFRYIDPAFSSEPMEEQSNSLDFPDTLDDVFLGFTFPEDDVTTEDIG